MNKTARLDAANALIRCIAERGRRFFAYEGRVSQFELDSRGRVWFIDAWKGSRIYTHYPYEWRGFSQGGTLKCLVIGLRDFICHAKMLSPGALGPWPEWYCAGDLWGYGDEMIPIRELAGQFRIIAQQEAPC